MLPPGRARTLDRPAADRVGDGCEHDWDRAGLLLLDLGYRRAMRDDEVEIQARQLRRVGVEPASVSIGHANLNPQIAAFAPAE